MLLTSSDCMARCSERVTPVAYAILSILSTSSPVSTAHPLQARYPRQIAGNLPPLDPFQQRQRAPNVSDIPADTFITHTVS